jgi:hypothetical protein
MIHFGWFSGVLIRLTAVFIVTRKQCFFFFGVAQLLWSPARCPKQLNDNLTSQKIYLAIQLPMSEPVSPSPSPGPIVTQFSVQLVFHTKVSALTSSGKPTQKNKKEVKSKELSFACTDTNYIGFLRAILDKQDM